MVAAEDISSLKVVELKERLEALGLPIKGLKAELVSRLQSAMDGAESPVEIREADEPAEEEATATATATAIATASPPTEEVKVEKEAVKGATEVQPVEEEEKVEEVREVEEPAPAPTTFVTDTRGNTEEDALSEALYDTPSFPTGPAAQFKSEANQAQSKRKRSVEPEEDAPRTKYREGSNGGGGGGGGSYDMETMLERELQRSAAAASSRSYRDERGRSGSPSRQRNRSSHSKEDGRHARGEEGGRREDRSRDSRSREDRSRRHHSRSIESSSRRHRSVTPIEKRPRRVTNWDIAPIGFEGMTSEQVKLTGAFPIPGRGVPQTMLPANVAHSDAILKLLVEEEGGALPPPTVLPAPNLPPGASMTHGGESGQFGQGGHGRPGNAAGIYFPGSAGPYGGVGGGPAGHMQGGGAGGASFNRQARRLYFGNMPHGTTESAIAIFVNESLQQLKQTGTPGIGEGDAIISVALTSEKNFAFIEFRTAEETTAATNFNGMTYMGNTLKVKRPKDYVAGAEAVGMAPTATPGPGGAETYNRLFIGNIPLYLSEEQVRELVVTIGAVQHFHLVKEASTGLSKGYAFCEFEDPSLVEQAIEGLNGMELGDKKLTVQRASQSSNAAPGKAPLGAGGAGGPQGMVASAAAAAEHILPYMEGASADMRPTPVLQLLNIVSPDDLLIDQEYEEVLEDVREECGKFGQIVEVRIPRPRKEGFAPGLGRVFVRFGDAIECAVALRALAGRKFSDRIVLTAYVKEDAFEEERY